MRQTLTGNLGLKILALVLAIVVYYSLKTDSRSTTVHNDRFIQDQTR